jgi:hypothetical protein
MRFLSTNALTQSAHAINPAVPALRNNLASAYEIPGTEDKALIMLEEAVAANSAAVARH